jgi:GNAT superfamily N-acetyltransferase
MGAFIVKVACADDAPAVADLLEASYSQLLAGHYPEELLARALPLMTRANVRLLTSGTFFLATAGDGSAVGCGGWTLERPGTGETVHGVAHIRHFATHPGWTGKGVGRALLSRAIREAEAVSATTIEVFSTLNAETFYRAAGFTRLGAIELPFTPQIKFPAVHMARKSAQADAHDETKG